MYGILELPLSPILSLEWDVKENPPEFRTKLYFREKYDLK